MKTPKEIESLARRTRFEPDASADERILIAAQAALHDRTDTTRVGLTRLTGRRIMKRRISKLTAAAAAIVAALLALHFLDGTSNTVWGAVLEKVLTMDTCVFRIRTMETTGPRPDGFEFATETETKVYRSALHGALDECFRNGELYTRFYQRLQQGECVGICYPLEEYTRRPMNEAQIRELNEKHPQRVVAKVLEARYMELGEDVYEGKRTAGVELRDPAAFFDGPVPMQMDDFTARVWIDKDTQLPVVVDISYVETGSPKRTTVVLDAFQWGVPLEASLFEPHIPAHFMLDTWEDSRPDATARTQSAESFAAGAQGEPYLSDFDHVVLPDLNKLTLLGVDANAPRANVRLLSHGEIWELQDAFMATWPPFEEVREQLRTELQEKLNIDQLSVDELVATGIALRERFWAVVGCFSETSYPYAYAARIVTETAHERAPENLAVTDQLVESITTYAVTRTWHEDENQSVRNPIYSGLLTELRLAQFEQIRSEVSRGRVPAWKDFVRVHDLAILFSSNRKDYGQAARVAQWLIAQAPTAGWAYYLESLTKMEQACLRGEGYRTGLFLYGPDAFPEEYQYSRRPFSFQGPRERSRRLLPIHLRHLKGW